MATQQAAVQVIQALKAGYADSYSAVGHVVDTASVQLTGQPSATSRQLSALNVAASANAAATGTRAVTVGALSIMPTLTSGTVGSNVGYTGGTAGGSSGGGFLSLPAAGVVGGVLAGGVALAAALPTAASVLGRALLSGSASVGGVVPFRSIALPGPGVQSGVTMYQISPAGGSAAGNRPIGVAYGTTVPAGAANQSQNGGAAGGSAGGVIPPGTVLPDGTVVGSSGQPGIGGSGTTPPGAGSLPDLSGLPKSGGGAGLGGLGGGGVGGAVGGGGIGGLGAGLARTVAFSDLSSMAGGAAATVAAPAGAMGSMAGGGMNGMMPMMPMGAGAGAGAGGEGGNRRVPTWLVETEDVWGETAAVAPGVIGEVR